MLTAVTANVSDAGMALDLREALAPWVETGRIAPEDLAERL